MPVLLRVRSGIASPLELLSIVTRPVWLNCHLSMGIGRLLLCSRVWSAIRLPESLPAMPDTNQYRLTQVFRPVWLWATRNSPRRRRAKNTYPWPWPRDQRIQQLVISSILCRGMYVPPSTTLTKQYSSVEEG